MLVRPMRFKSTTIAVLVCALLLSMQVQAQKAPACLAQNPLIRMLKRNDVKVFDQPQPSSSNTCKHEWKPHLTCCDNDSLVDYAEKDIKKLESSIKNVQKDVKALMTFLKKNEDDIQKAIAKKDLQNKKEFKQVLETDLKAFKTLLESMLENENKEDDRRENCFDRIKEIRTSSLCYTCSGRSGYFFLQGRALISMADCRRTIKRCDNTWAKSVELIDTIAVAKKIRKHLKEVVAKDELIDFGDKHIDRLEEWIGTQQVRGSVKLCQKDATCSDASAKLLCETFISLGKEDFLTDTGNMIRESTPVEAGAPNGAAGNSAAWVVGGSPRLLQQLVARSEDSSPIQQTIQVATSLPPNNAPMDMNGFP